MELLVYYPTNDFGPLMKGLIIGGMGIFHVFLAQFAIGGGMLMCYFQWLAQTGREPDARRLLDGYFRFLVLLSFVLGALTGVGMWFTTIQISAPTIGRMVEEFHWLWATEYTFFYLELIAGYAFYRYAQRLNDFSRMSLLLLYTAGGWMSLFWINGILSWQLTPGAWLDQQTTWAGFFNPSFWPSLFFRTIVAMTLAALVGCVVVNTMPDLDRERRRRLINRMAHFLAPMVLMPVFGYWFMAVIPDDSRSWILGGSPVMTMFLNITVASSLLIGLYALIGLVIQKLYIDRATALLLLAMAFGATAGGEFVREGIRKPFTIRQTLYSNSVTPEAVAHLRAVGAVEADPYPLRDVEQYPNGQVAHGAKVYRFLCSVCHTLEGVNGLVDLTGAWSPDQMRLNIAKLQQTKTFMPPFAGNASDVEALVQMLRWRSEGRPSNWPLSSDPATFEQIERWLDEAGTEPGISRELTGHASQETN